MAAGGVVEHQGPSRSANGAGRLGVVHEALGSGQAQSHTGAGRPSIGHRQVQVGDAGAAIDEVQAGAWRGPSVTTSQRMTPPLP